MNLQYYFMLIYFGLCFDYIYPLNLNPHSSVSCSNDEFMCKSNGKCIQLSWRCDSETDCSDGEDEFNCDRSTIECSHDQYRCSSSSSIPYCIPKMFQCDGDTDCHNADDEKNCKNITCDLATHMKCVGHTSDTSSCIPLTWVCDGLADCADGTDELNCKATNSTCNETEFRCKNGRCIDKEWVCDNDKDCSDGSDEENCSKACPINTTFACGNGPCIPIAWRCDGELDCTDHSDELNCSAVALNVETCTDKQFTCKNNMKCINLAWVCDGDFDCVDKSDEANCKTIHCNSNEQSCADEKSCVDLDAICDGHLDCADGSDEHNCVERKHNFECNEQLEYACQNDSSQCIKYTSLCLTNASNSDCAVSVCNKQIFKCDEKDPLCKCRNTGTKGKVCHCKQGYINKNGKCEVSIPDINECEEPGICDQICSNNYGSYSCHCYPGYKLTIATGTSGSVHKCRATGSDPKLLLSNRATIRQYDIVTHKYHPLISHLESAVALDYWHKNQTLIWSDVSKEQIMICHIGNHTEIHEIDECLEHGKVTLINKDIKTPDGLAVDWVHGLLFWTDTGFKTLSVFDLNTHKRKVLFDKDLGEPRAIVVDPSVGLIFWSDWGKTARIERAGMNGENRKVIISGESIRWPNGLALDILVKRLYWADAKLKVIMSSDYWGKDIRTVLHSHRYLSHPFSLAVFEEKLYWTDWDHEGVLSVNKFYGNDVKTVVSGMTGLMTVRVYHEQAQPEHSNKCEMNECNHLCLPRAHLHENSENGESLIVGAPYTCACDTGFKISVVNSSLCIPMDLLGGIITPQVSSSRIPFIYFLLLIAAAAVLLVAYTQFRQRPTHFTVLHFDNPIYRRTVEDVDADMDNLVDNSLGAISALPVSTLTNSKDAEAGAQFLNPAVGIDSLSKSNGLSMNSVVNITNLANYSYDQ